MKNWPAKRIGFTICGFISTAFCCWLLVKVLEIDGSEPLITAFVTVGTGYCLLVMTLALGKAATLREQEKQLPQTWTRSVREPGCDLCPEPDQFVYCKTHKFFMCWECCNRHVTGRDDCVLVPIDSQAVPHLVKK